jgi:hypothetical protein
MGNDKIEISVFNVSTFLFCSVLVLLVLHFSCGANSQATGMLKDVCTNGMGFWDYIGTVCCSPIYLFLLVIYSTGVKVW